MNSSRNSKLMKTSELGYTIRVVQYQLMLCNFLASVCESLHFSFTRRILVLSLMIFPLWFNKQLFLQFLAKNCPQLIHLPFALSALSYLGGCCCYYAVLSGLQAAATDVLANDIRWPSFQLFRSVRCCCCCCSCCCCRAEVAAGTRHTVRLILLFRSFFLLLLGCCYQSMFQAGCVSELV